MYLRELLARYGDASLTFTTHRETTRAGKSRLIAVPTPALARMQRELLEFLQSRSFVSGFSSSVTGCLPQRSPLWNARKHDESRWFYQLDFANAFGSARASRIAYWLHEFVSPAIGSREEIEAFLTRYCFVPGAGLAQGGPLSPLLFNTCCIDLDFALGELVKKKAVIYTRYVDDLTFSSWSRPLSPVLRKKIRKIIRECGFEINSSKTRVLARDQGDEAVVVTGIRLLPGGRLAFGTGFLDALEAALNECLHAGGVPDARLAGMVGHFKSLKSRAPNRQERRIRAKVAQLVRPERAERSESKRVERFSPGELADLRAKVPLEHLVGEVVKLKPSGKSEFKGLCPFHRERTPSFFVVSEKGFYHCFGCGAHGDAIGFVMRVYHTSFVRAVRYLQRWIGAPDLAEKPRTVEEQDPIPF